VTAGGLGAHRVAVGNGGLTQLDEAHLRPPSYRSHWTASGSSWVANGFRLPERVSQRMMRWSDRSSRNRFMGRGGVVGRNSETTVSSIEPGMPRMSEISSDDQGRGRVSALSAVTDRSGVSRSRSDEDSGRSQAGFSTNARISDMSSLSAGTTSNAFRPPPLFQAPIGVARGSGRGLMP
jgi:hypothetical protein